jgi:hypothetical protein
MSANERGRCMLKVKAVKGLVSWSDPETKITGSLSEFTDRIVFVLHVGGESIMGWQLLPGHVEDLLNDDIIFDQLYCQTTLDSEHRDRINVSTNKFGSMTLHFIYLVHGKVETIAMLFDRSRVLAFNCMVKGLVNNRNKLKGIHFE